MLQSAQVGQRLDDDDTRRRTAPRAEDVGHELSVVRALLDEREVARVSQVPPHLEKLRGKEFAEDGSDADAGEKVAAFSGA